MAGASRKTNKNKKSFCEQCKLPIKEEEDFIECDKCAKKFHSQCTKLDKRQFEYFVNNESEVFVCHICEGGDGEVKKELQAITTKLNKLDQLSDIQKTIQFMSEQYDTILKGVAENKKKLRQLENENQNLRIEINNLKSSVKSLNDDRVKKNCIISGLKVEDGTTAADNVVQLSKSIGVEIEPQNIEDAYFIVNKNKNRLDEKKSVVVKFTSKLCKEKLMSAKQKLKQSESTSAVFINDFLSKETLSLLEYARTLKNVGYKHVFVRNGRVFYKKSDTSRPQVVRSEEEVDKILLGATTNSKLLKRRSMVSNNNSSIAANKEVTSDDDDDLEYVSPN